MFECKRLCWRKKLATKCMRMDGVVFLNDFVFNCVKMGQRLCADVFRSLLRSKISFVGGVIDKKNYGSCNEWLPVIDRRIKTV